MKKIFFISFLAILVLTGCTSDYQIMQEELENKDITIRTFDTEGGKIDEIHSSHNILSADREFAETFDGSIITESNVLSFFLDGNQFIHVGSSLILEQKGLNDLLGLHKDTYNQEDSNDIGLVNSMLENKSLDLENQKYLILVRSQNGFPIAAYASKDLKYFKPSIDNATGLKLEGKYLLFYRTDYTIYDLDLFR